MPMIAFAQNEMGQGLSDTAIKNKFLSTVKDVEVEKSLGASAEFNKCRTDSRYTDAISDADKNAKLQAAKICFNKLLTTKSEAELKKLSSTLGLESYGLVKSNNVNDITEYLENKMTKALTGRDPKEKDPKKILEQMKWKNQKIVDQKVFVDLYKNQLMKNALFEVSRYCFENLRWKTSQSDSFAKHWALNSIPSQADKNGKLVYTATKAHIKDLTDTGNPPFFKLDDKLDMSDKEAVTGAIVGSLADGAPIEPAQYEAYFAFCSSALPLMCNDYKENTLGKTKGVDETSIDTKSSTPTLTSGAHSCLVMDRLRNIRKAMEDTEKVAKQFDTMDHVDGKLAIQMLDNPQFYGSKSDESVDQLTSTSSTDMLVGSEKNKDLKKLEDDCLSGNGGSKCDDYLVESDGLEKSLNNIEVEMTLKREAEAVRVSKIKDNDKDLKAYLTENGMFEILNDLESGKLTPNDIENKVREIFDARKVAMVQNLQNKMGKRQISEKEMTEAEKNKTTGTLQSANIKESRQEKARLAQVVMFNNIITSQLNLEDSKGTKLGRNVTAWNKEIKGITKDGGMKEDDKLFSGLQETAKGVKAIDNASLGDGGIIDSILGKKAD